MNFSADFSRRYEKLPVSIFKEQSDASKLILDFIIETNNQKIAEGKNVYWLYQPLLLVSNFMRIW